MAEVRLIDANAAVENASKRYDEWNLAMAAAEGNRQINIVYKKQELFKAVKKVVESCPTIDLKALYPTAQWKLQYSFLGDENFVCTFCGEILVLEDGTPSENDYKFCPFCGAKIVGEEKPEDADDD